MAKYNKKKKKKKTEEYDRGAEARKAVKESLKKFNWKRLIVLVLSTAAALAAFEIIQQLELQNYISSQTGVFSFDFIPVVYYVYYALVLVLTLAVVILNRGLSRKELTPDMFEPDTAPDEVAEICEKVNKQKRLAKKLMMVLLPFLFAVLLDFLVVFFGNSFF